MVSLNRIERTLETLGTDPYAFYALMSERGAGQFGLLSQI